MTWRWLGTLLAFTVLPCMSAADLERERCLSDLDRGDYAAAMRDAAELVRSHPKSAEARVLLAQAEIGTNDPRSALLHLREALELDPANVDALYFLSKLTAVLSQQELAAVLKLDPDGARAHQLSAEISAAQGDAPAAEQEYRKALEKRPGSAGILTALGDLNRNQLKFDAALGWYQKAVAADAGNYDAVYGAGASLWFLKRVPEAEKQFRRALQLDSGSLAAKVALGETLLAQGKTLEAIKYLEPPAQAEPNFRRLQFLLGRAYKAAGREADANRAFARYRQLSSGEHKDQFDELALEAKP